MVDSQPLMLQPNSAYPQHLCQNLIKSACLAFTLLGSTYFVNFNHIEWPLVQALCPEIPLFVWEIYIPKINPWVCQISLVRWPHCLWTAAKENQLKIRAVCLCINPSGDAYSSIPLLYWISTLSPYLCFLVKSRSSSTYRFIYTCYVGMWFFIYLCDDR